MISISCPNCKTAYELDDSLAGVRAECEVCYAKFTIPMTESSPLAPPVSSKLEVDFEKSPSPPSSSEKHPRLPPRLRRLQMEAKKMDEGFSSSPYIHIEAAEGNPPERYVVSYVIRGVEKVKKSKVTYRDLHKVEIKLTSTYPRTAPVCKMLTPIFHPNISPSVICIGDHWTAAETLCSLVVRIGELIAYQAHNIQSPLDGDAAMWTDLNKHLLPTDTCDLLPPENFKF